MHIKIRVKTGAARESLVRKPLGMYYISVKEPAQENRANRRVTALMRAEFPGRTVRIIKGHHSPAKIVEIN